MRIWRGAWMSGRWGVGEWCECLKQRREEGGEGESEGRWRGRGERERCGVCSHLPLKTSNRRCPGDSSWIWLNSRPPKRELVLVATRDTVSRVNCTPARQKLSCGDFRDRSKKETTKKRSQGNSGKVPGHLAERSCSSLEVTQGGGGRRGARRGSFVP